MSFTDRVSAAYSAFVAGPPARSIETMFTSVPRGPKGESTQSETTRVRAARKRRLSPIMVSRSRWLRADVEKAMATANNGELREAAQIADWVKDDLVVGGLAATRCSFPRLKRQWQGDDCVRQWFEGNSETPGVFDEFFPPDELEELAVDHLIAGWGVAPFVIYEDKRFPQLTRIDNQWTRYQAGQNRYVYQSYGETLTITPGKGVWVFHGDGQDPWHRGIWKGLGFDQVSEDQAGLNRDAFIGKYSNPFVIASAAQGLSDDQKFVGWKALQKWTMGFLGSVGGFKVDLLQPKAEGREIITDAEAKVERRAMMRIAGQIVTSLGGPGFANAEIFAIIASFLVTRSAQSLTRTLNTQAIPQVIKWAQYHGYLPPGELCASLTYDTTPPQARKAEAEAVTAAAYAFMKLKEAGFDPDAAEFINRYRLPATVRAQDHTPAGAAPIFAYHIQGGIVTINEVRASLGLSAVEWGDKPATSAEAASQEAPQDPTAPNAKPEEEPEPTYSEGIAAELNARNDETCPCGEGWSCARCMVTRRHAVKDGQWSRVWMPFRRRSA